MHQARVLIVHHDPSILALLGSMLQPLGHQIDEASQDSAAVRRLERTAVDLLIARIDPADPEALELLKLSKRRYPRLPVILLSPTGSPDRSLEAMRLGANSVLMFPIRANDFRSKISGAFAEATRAHPGSAPPGPTARRVARTRRAAAPGAARPSTGPDPDAGGAGRLAAKPGVLVLGQDPAFRRAVDLAATVASNDAPMLIVGEPGTGKTSISRMIHGLGPRSGRPFQMISCRGIDELALANELFDRPSRNARVSGPGRLALADGGTLALSEIDALSIALQARLLAVLDQGTYLPLGASRKIPVDARFVFSTAGDLQGLVDRGGFLPELFARINVVSIKLPPLRERGWDVIRLAEHFLERFSRPSGGRVLGLSPEASRYLGRHDWPGNVRELESLIRRGVASAAGPELTLADLAIDAPPPVEIPLGLGVAGASDQPGPMLVTLKKAMEAPERQILIDTLCAADGNRSETARVLAIDRTTLYSKLRKYGLLTRIVGGG